MHSNIVESGSSSTKDTSSVVKHVQFSKHSYQGSVLLGYQLLGDQHDKTAFPIWPCGQWKQGRPSATMKRANFSSCDMQKRRLGGRTNYLALSLTTILRRYCGYTINSTCLNRHVRGRTFKREMCRTHAPPLPGAEAHQRSLWTL